MSRNEATSNSTVQRVRKLVGFTLKALLFLVVVFSSNANAVEIKEIRTWHGPEKTRIVFDTGAPVEYNIFQLPAPERIVIDITNGVYKKKPLSSQKAGPYIDRVRVGLLSTRTRFIFELNQKVSYHAFTLISNDWYGDRLIVDIEPAEKTSATSKVIESDSQGKFIVVIDAGHGGEDPGAIGAKKTQEKKVVLEIARLLKKEIDKQPGMKAVLTRDGDYYISLRKRIEIAHKHSANLFLSIHTGAFDKPSMSGISLFALSKKGATSEKARILAKKENASDLIGGSSPRDKDDDLAETLLDMSVSKQIEYSRELGRILLKELRKVSEIHGNRVKQARFVVLKSPDIPSLLIETGFISNPEEEMQLSNRAYQKKLAESITSGIVAFASKYHRNSVALQSGNQ